MIRQKNEEESVFITQDKSTNGLAIGLYLEHLEEASFLYEQRLTLFDDPEITWVDIDDFEERFEAHIDGLVVGEELALEVCKQQAEEGDFGELHAAIRVFCRQNRLDLVEGILEKLDVGDEESVMAVCDALKYELPVGWQDEFIKKLAGKDLKLATVLAKVIGFRRLNAGRELFQALLRADSESSPSIIWAIGRLRERGANDLLLDWLEHEDEAIRTASALTLLRTGEHQAADRCLVSPASHDWALIPISLGGSRSAIPTLMSIASGAGVSPDCLIAQGLLGDISAIDVLLSKLIENDLAESAATALNLVTGAELYEEAFIPEEMEEDELFEEEIEDFREGLPPVRPDGEPFGITITRISQNPEEWQTWWEENKPRFNPKIRYRNGKPYSPSCLLENLESEKSPNSVRRLAYEELVIRYGIDVPFEIDMLVTEQKQALSQFVKLIGECEGRFQEGTWYFAGKLMP